MDFYVKNMCKSLSNKYGQKLLGSAKKSTTDAIKTESKIALQKRAEGTGDLIGNKIDDKTTSVSTELHLKKKSATDWHFKELPNDEAEDVEIDTPKKRCISPGEGKQNIPELRLVPKKYVRIKMHIRED